MGSEIWRVQSEKIGSLEAFQSERDMESFLINNPAIVGCWDPNVSSSIPALIREQISTLTDKFEKGRMDLVGIARNGIDDGYELRIFELKKVEIIEAAVDQLDKYLKGWNAQKSAKKKIEEWILGLKIKELPEADISELVGKPVGVLVGPKYSPEAIAKARSLKIRGIRLARFKAASSPEYYVIVEDVIGDIVDKGRGSWSWKDLSLKGLISDGDYFLIKHDAHVLRAKPDSKTWGGYKKKVVFDEKSKALLLSLEAVIRKSANKDHKRWLNKELSSLKRGDGVYLSNATGLCFLAFGGPTSTYWGPISWWYHETNERCLADLVKEYLGR